MAHLHKKIKKGRPYYYIREIARIDGKPTVVNQVYLGSPEKIMQMALRESTSLEKLQVQEFGALWMADLIEREIDLASIVDSVIPTGKNEKGPSVGQYFLYAVLNRMVDSCSKRGFPQWFKETAVSQIRPVEVEALTSQRYWDKWDRVSQEQIGQIAEQFFHRIARLCPPDPGGFLFDTTNYYTYMATQTESDLAARAKNKDGKDWLRQVGVALLSARNSGLPLFYQEYEGQQHDSKLMAEVMEHMVQRLSRLAGQEANLTLVFDKGMNAEDNLAFIDQTPNLHFITTYSTYHSPELMDVELSAYTPVEITKNKQLRSEGQNEDLTLAYRTTGPYWNQDRTVVVTYNPRTARKQRYALEKKLMRLKAELYTMQAKTRQQLPRWRRPVDVEKRYHKICEQLHISKDFYHLSFESRGKGWMMSFRKNPAALDPYFKRFGKNVMVTDNHDWSTEDIVQASRDRWMIENAFRQSKDDDLVSVLPIRHWTDSKIRCHIFTCIVALTLLKLMEIRLHQAGLEMTSSTAIAHMKTLHSCLAYLPDKRKPARVLEQPNPIQALILNAFGYKITSSGVLQKVS